MTTDAPTEFHVEVVRLGPVTPHPNADTLDITTVYGYPVILKRGSFSEGDLAVYVPVDALVPTVRPEFAFLAKSGDADERHRVRAARLRGAFSMGLLVPADSWMQVGTNVQADLGITKWIPPEDRKREGLAKGTERARKSPGWMPVYGVEAYRRNPNVLVKGEVVVLTEKIHGTNARYCFHNGQLYVGSHRTLRGTSRKPIAEWFDRLKIKLLTLLGRKTRADLFANAGDVWWQMAIEADLKTKLATKPDHVVYGEIYGHQVQDLTYGLVDRRFRVFDVLSIPLGRYLSHDELEVFARDVGLECVPVLYRGPWFTELLGLADGKSTLAPGQIREGFVVRPLVERVEPGVGRVILKVVGESYLLRKGG